VFLCTQHAIDTGEHEPLTLDTIEPALTDALMELIDQYGLTGVRKALRLLDG
jgi:hypothetical protein